MNDWAINGVSSAFDIIIVTYFFRRRLTENPNKLLKAILPIIIWSIMTCAASMLSGSPLVPITVLISFMIYSSIYRDSIRNRILSAAMVFLAMLSAELISGILLMTIHKGDLSYIQNNNIFYLQGAILSKLILFVELNIINQFKERDAVLVNGKTVLSLIIIAVSSIVSVYFIAMYAYNTDNIITSSAALGVTVTIVLSLICTFGVFDSIIASQREKLRLKEEKDYYLNMINSFKQQREHQEEMRKLNHDMKNILLSVMGAIDKTDNKKAEEIINECLEKISGDYEYGSDTLSMLINSKKKAAEKHNILFDYQAVIGSIDINETDLCILLGNMLDNAVEACCFVKSERRIEFKIRSIENIIYISCKNTCADDKLNLETKKPGKLNHGIGIKSMKEIVDKYGGNIRFECDGGLFSCEVILPCRVEVGAI